MTNMQTWKIQILWWAVGNDDDDAQTNDSKHTCAIHIEHE